MALELFMVGLMPRDMEKSLEFYQRLGLDIPDGSQGKPHVGVKMSEGLTFFLNNTDLVNSSDRPCLMLEFHLKERATVDATYAEMTSFGYQTYREPFVTSFGMYFAMINDPDGNVILLSAENE